MGRWNFRVKPVQLSVAPRARAGEDGGARGLVRVAVNALEVLEQARLAHEGVRRELRRTGPVHADLAKSIASHKLPETARNPKDPSVRQNA